MNNSDPFRQQRILNYNHKNLYRSSSMQYFPSIIKNMKDSVIENININTRYRRNKFLKFKESQNINLYYLKKKNPSFIIINQNMRLNSYQSNIMFPKISLNQNRNTNKDNNISFHNKKIYNKYQSIKNYKDATTHYSESSPHDSNFILNQKIKIMKDSNLNTNMYNTQFIEEKKNEDYSNKKNTTAGKKLYFNRLMPSDLKLFKNKLFNESSRDMSNKSNSQDVPIEKGKRIISNSKINSSLRNSKVSSQSKKSFDDKGYQNINLNGVITKVITKLSVDDDASNKNNDKKNIDYHKIMKHPFIVETFGYDFLRNKKHKYKIYENPFDDKNLASNIHNLIINPNTKKFRNDNLILGQESYKRKNSSDNKKNYKLLSRLGLQRLQKDAMRNLKKKVKESMNKMKRVQCNLDTLMENNIKQFKEHKDELTNEEL